MKPVRSSITDVHFSIRKISEKAATMDDVVRLDIGQPDFDTPDVVKERIHDVITDQPITYTSLWGIPQLREEIAAFEGHKADFTEEHVMVSTGGIGALYCILNAFLDLGDNVVVNDPSWSPYELLTAATPGTRNQVSYFDEAGEVREDAIRDTITDDTVAIILNSPENPTGRVYTEDQMKQLGEIAEDEDLYIVSDEVYDQLLYDGEHVSPARFFPDRTFVVNSMSKNFAMTGWRLGWTVMKNADLIHEVGKVNRATTACPNFLAQQAALIALQEAQGYAAAMRQEYRERRDLVMQHINDLGWDCVEPQGAIYAFPNVEQDSWDFALDLLEQEKVALVPGSPDGPSSDTNVRICFGSANKEQINEGFDRIKTFATDRS